MEVAIPLITLGGLYVMANKDEPKKEEFTVSNRTNIKHSNPNHSRVNPNHTLKPRNIPRKPQRVSNEPIPAGEPMNAVEADLRTEPGYYPTSGAAIERYYLQSKYEDEAEKDDSIHMSLTGDPVKKTDLTHNNMVPFFGSKVSGTTYGMDRHEAQMDTLQGAGSQYIRKQEQAPLFEPKKDMGWAHGMPDTSTFVQSRMNPAMRMNNVKPWEEEQVAPGLNQPGSSAGSGGFNSALEARQRWIPKTVDELRTATNPKITYDGVTLGGQRPVQNRGIHGRVEKQRPDTYFINTPDRYLTTTGVEKAQSARAAQVLRPENRTTTTREYFGGTTISESEAPRAPQNFRPSTRPQLDAPVNHLSNPHAKGKYAATTNDYGIQGYQALPNARSLTTTRTPNQGGVSGIAKAVISPLLDMLRPSRKENVIGNLRPTGNAQTAVKESYVYNPADRAKTTIREMTETNPYPMNVGNSQYQGYGYQVNKHQSFEQQRDSTNTEYIGQGGAVTSERARTYDAEYNARLNPNKEVLARSRTAVGNHNAFNPHQNIKIDKLDCDRKQNRWNVPQNTVKQTPSMNTYGAMNARSEFGQNIQMERNQPELLNAFRQNPYAQSLQSWA